LDECLKIKEKITNRTVVTGAAACLSANREIGVLTLVGVLEQSRVSQLYMPLNTLFHWRLTEI
jgi:hypothetical protein